MNGAFLTKSSRDREGAGDRMRHKSILQRIFRRQVPSSGAVHLAGRLRELWVSNTTP